MRWFKHFTDNHRGQIVQTLMNEFGHAGPCAYYFIMELCAEKLEKLEFEDASKPKHSSFIFTFKRPYFDNVLRMKRKSTENILRTLSQSGACLSEANDNEVRIEMPILLNLLDRDMKKPRKNREGNAEKPRLEEEEDKEIEEDKDIDCIATTNIPAVEISEIKIERTKFEVIDELKGIPTLDEVLSNISPKVQRAWVERFADTNALKTSLLNAINHNRVKSPGDIKDWGERLNRWIRFEKKLKQREFIFSNKKEQDPFDFLPKAGVG